MDLRSSTVDVTDEYAAMEYFWDQGWTDGLPIVAPTQDRIEACLAHAALDPEDVIGSYEARASALTAEKLAINAVTYWDALRRCGIQDRIHGHGRILAEF